MSRHGTFKLFLLAGLSTLLVILALALFAGGRQHSAGVWVIFSITICISMAAVVVVFISMKKRQARIGSLPKSYIDAFLDIQELIGLSTIRPSDKTRIAAMVLEIFEHAALNGRTVQDVTGGNLSHFLDGFFKAAGGETSLLYSMLYSSSLFSGFLVFMKTYKVFRHSGFSSEGLQTEVLDQGIVISYAIISFVFFPWLRTILRRTTREQWQGLKRGLILLPFIIPVGLMAMLMSVKTEPLRGFLDHPFPLMGSVNLYIIWCAVFAASLIGMQLVRRWLFRKNLNE